jgi:hypothetical protein
MEREREKRHARTSVLSCTSLFLFCLVVAFLACMSGGILATPAGTVTHGGDERVQLLAFSADACYDFELLERDRMAAFDICFFALEGFALLRDCNCCCGLL